MSDKPPGAEKKIVARIFGILLGGLAIHKFYLGYTKEGIIYLTKSDEDFVATYITGKRGWF
jgi:TM2 domain-containing membrane protein YozV